MATDQDWKPWTIVAAAFAVGLATGFIVRLVLPRNPRLPVRQVHTNG